ncbi:MAG: restriction endonuclease subunit R, partial [Candidatus Moranbacteria bacterium]|nr:restriction endonuclease subunit R [Candidatus Moranbacteria bacterium]
KKGQNTDLLPKLPVYDREIEHIENEGDVEQQLIEPLLKDLGFNESDWIRQLPLRMGRQTKYYPDYAIKANALRGKEKAQIVLEAKYSINSDKQLQEAFDQSRSYGLRLQAEKIILVDRDFVWVYGRTDGDFNSIPILKMHWNELTDSDRLFKLKALLK